MTTVVKSILAFVFLLLVGACSSRQSLQEYYVDKAENSNFISFDVPTSILNMADADLSVTEKEAIRSLKKLNVLAFKKTAENSSEYVLEKSNVKSILKDEKFTQLMKMKTSFGNATIKYLGDEDAIDEVVIYGDNDEKGFAVVRVLGDNMNPAHLVTLIKAMEKSNYNGEGLGKLKDLLN